MTQQHDAPEGGAAQPVAWRAWSESGQAWRLYHEDLGVDADLTRWEPLYPGPPVPSGLVDAVRAYRKAEQGFNEGRVSPHQLAQARSTLDATLSGQQGGAVPAGNLPSRASDVALATSAIEAGFRWGLPHRPEQDAELEKTTWDATHALLERLSRARLAEQPAPARSFQARNASWMERVFAGDPTDLSERVNRFGEEALELQQALGQTAAEAHALVDYVHGRPIGEPGQEYGGTMTTLALLASVTGHDLMACGEAELARCSTPEIVAKIREKRSKRHGRGPLPGTYAPDFVPAPAGTEAQP